MYSSIFLNDLTVIDFSIINNQGQLVGGSATLNLEVTGPVDSHEGVVIDFSACKKQIKELIDGEFGFDHKCWVPTNDPNITFTNTVDPVTNESHVALRHGLTGLTISAHADAFSFINDMSGCADIRDFLNEHLAPYQVSNVYLNTSIIPVPHCNTASSVFRYVHGLKYSSSYGCKNIVHGHKSYISGVCDTNNYDVNVANHVISTIASSLDRVIFADAEDLKTNNAEYTVSYTTEERGLMSMTFTQKLIVLETQTTVEHLVEYIRAVFYDQLKAAGITELYVSEGLCKGAKVFI